VDTNSWTRYDQGMKRWLRFSLWAAAALTGLVIIIFVAFGWLFSIPPRSYQKIGGRWFSATETPLLAESGRKPKYLARGGAFLRKTVAEDITGFRYLGMTASCIRLQATGRTKCTQGAEVTIRFFSTMFLTTKKFQWCRTRFN